jgi:DNA-binding LacI/PurR family transcriptional regulator
MMNSLLNKGYKTIPINVDFISHEVSPLFKEHHFDGIIIYGTVPNSDFFKGWGEKHRIPYIFLHNEQARTNNVGINEKETASLLISELYNLGFRKLAYYFPRKTRRDFLFPREQSVIQAAKGKNIELFPDSVEQHRHFNCAEFLMKKLSNAPECIIAHNFDHAMWFYQEAQKLNIKIPEDTAVVSCEWNKYCTFITPTLCCVAFNTTEIGRNAAEMIIARMESGKNIENISTVGKLIYKYNNIDLESLNFFQNVNK